MFTCTMPAGRQTGLVRRASSRSGNEATLPFRSRETLPLAGFFLSDVSVDCVFSLRRLLGKYWSVLGLH